MWLAFGCFCSIFLSKFFVWKVLFSFLNSVREKLSLNVEFHGGNKYGFLFSMLFIFNFLYICVYMFIIWFIYISFGSGTI
jgi:hypothetical protein